MHLYESNRLDGACLHCDEAAEAHHCAEALDAQLNTLLDLLRSVEEERDDARALLAAARGEMAHLQRALDRAHFRAAMGYDETS